MDIEVEDGIKIDLRTVFGTVRPVSTLMGIFVYLGAQLLIGGLEASFGTILLNVILLGSMGTAIMTHNNFVDYEHDLQTKNRPYFNKALNDVTRKVSILLTVLLILIVGLEIGTVHLVLAAGLFALGIVYSTSYVRKTPYIPNILVAGVAAGASFLAGEYYLDTAQATALICYAFFVFCAVLCSEKIKDGQDTLGDQGYKWTVFQEFSPADILKDFQVYMLACGFFLGAFIILSSNSWGLTFLVLLVFFCPMYIWVTEQFKQENYDSAKRTLDYGIFIFFFFSVGANLLYRLLPYL